VRKLRKVQFEGQLQGFIEPAGPYKTESFGKCKVVGGVNIVIFWVANQQTKTDKGVIQKGQFQKIVWFNVSPGYKNIRNNPNNGFDRDQFAKDKKKIQNDLSKIIDDNEDNPDQAYKEIKAYLATSKDVDGTLTNEQLWKGPYKSLRNPKGTIGK
jgi:hypothetical protein